jgi:hypothetical protein
MGKNIRLGSAGPDDPIYKEGLQTFVPIPRPPPKKEAPPEVSEITPENQGQEEEK